MIRRMGRPRLKHRDMPPGCRLIAGRWYVEATNVHLAKAIDALRPGKKSMFLAVNKAEARAKYVHLFVRPLEQFAKAEAGTVAELVALARLDLLPKYRSTKGRTEADRYLTAIDREFGARRYARNNVEASTGQFLRRLDVQRYLGEHADSAPIAANRMVNVMHAMFRLASTLWGKTEYDPTAGVIRNPETPREQLPAPEQFEAVYAAAPEWLQCAMLLARDYARRRGEIMGLSVSDITPEGLRFARGKPRAGRSPRVILVEWDDALRATVARLEAYHARIESRTGAHCLRLLVNEDGKPITETGWNSAWTRAVRKAGIDRADFHFHDLRAVTPSTLDKDAAQHLLAHDDASSTRVYRRGPHVIKADFKKAG